MSGVPQIFGVGSKVTLTDGATVTLDASLGNFFTITLGGNRTFAAFTNGVPGQRLLLDVVQDGTGSRTITWNANVDWASNTAPTLTTTAAHRDLLEFVYDSTLDHWVGRVYSADSN